MADLNEQIRQRNLLRDREFRRQDAQYQEARRMDLAVQIEAGRSALAKLEHELATVMARLSRVEEVLDLREMYAREAVPCSVDRPGSYSCPGCCVCHHSA